MVQGAKLVVKTLELIAKGEVKTQTQNFESSLKEAPKLTPENTRINWNGDSDEIINLIRGLNPYPAAWSYLVMQDQKMRMKIYDGYFEEKEHNLERGQILEEERQLKVALVGGFICIDELQLPGKRKMKTKELLNGFHFEKEAHLL